MDGRRFKDRRDFGLPLSDFRLVMDSKLCSDAISDSRPANPVELREGGWMGFECDKHLTGQLLLILQSADWRHGEGVRGTLAMRSGYSTAAGHQPMKKSSLYDATGILYQTLR